MSLDKLKSAAGRLGNEALLLSTILSRSRAQLGHWRAVKDAGLVRGAAEKLVLLACGEAQMVRARPAGPAAPRGGLEPTAEDHSVARKHGEVTDLVGISEGVQVIVNALPQTVNSSFSVALPTEAYARSLCLRLLSVQNHADHALLACARAARGLEMLLQSTFFMPLSVALLAVISGVHSLIRGEITESLEELYKGLVTGVGLPRHDSKDERRTRVRDYVEMVDRVVARMPGGSLPASIRPEKLEAKPKAKPKDEDEEDGEESKMDVSKRYGQINVDDFISLKEDDHAEVAAFEQSREEGKRERENALLRHHERNKKRKTN